MWSFVDVFPLVIILVGNISGTRKKKGEAVEKHCPKKYKTEKVQIQKRW